MEQFTDSIIKELIQLHKHHNTGVHINVLSDTSEFIQIETNIVPDSAAKQKVNYNTTVSQFSFSVGITVILEVISINTVQNISHLLD